MDMKTYQQIAAETDQTPPGSVDDPTGKGMIIPLLGMAGEVGELLGEYKKYLRDGESHRLFNDRVAEELGDLLWYVTTAATKFGLDLDDIAERNTRKCKDRFGESNASPLFPDVRPHFDDRFPPGEQIPRKFVYTIREETQGRVRVSVYVDGQEIFTELSELTDNAYEDDGYRFHDVFHLSYAAVLGWSPIIRSGIKRKRKSNTQTDEVEDGGRAKAIEEGISAFVFSYAKDHSFLEGVDGISYDVLRVVKNMTAHLEVSQRTAREWEKAILKGFEIWRIIRKNRGGAIEIDMNKATMEVCDPPIAPKS